MGVVNAYTVAAAALLAVGMYCLASKRNLVKLVIGLEIVTIGVNLNFVGMGLSEQGVDSMAQTYVAINMAIGAAIIALALSFVIAVYRHYGTMDISKISRLRW